MQRILFHNPHDRKSGELAYLYPDATMINAFSKDERKKLFHVPVLPYLVDREVTIETAGPYYTGTITLSFRCRDHAGDPVPDEPILIVTVNGIAQEITPSQGMFEVEINCPIPTEINISVRDYRGQGYYPGDFLIIVEDPPQEEVIAPE